MKLDGLRFVVSHRFAGKRSRSFDSAEKRFAQDDRFVGLRERNMKSRSFDFTQGRLSTPLKYASLRMTGQW